MGCNCGNKTPRSTVPVQTRTVPVQSCNKCGKNPCACVEDHTLRIEQPVYNPTICTDNIWTMPEVNECVQLHFSNVENLLPNSILWNSSVGHLHVRSYDASTGYVLAYNKGGDDNAEAGTTFPSNMCFVVGIPTECDCNSDYTGACLKADFTSPATGETSNMSVTNVSNLFVGDTISVSGYMYRIVEILDINNIVVKNEGFGAPLGTVIKNDPNCTGKPCTVKVEVVNSDDPCTKDAVHEASSLVVCKDGYQQPLTGTADGQVAVWRNNKWNLITTNIEDTCSYMTACLVLDPTITSYIIYLADVTIFTVGKVFNIGSHVFTVTERNTTNKYIRATISQAPTAVATIDIGTTVCLNESDCDLENWCQVIRNNKNTLDSTVRTATWRPTSLQQLSGVYLTKLPEYNLQNLTASQKSKTITTNPITVNDFTGHAIPASATAVNVVGTITYTFKGDVHCDAHHSDYGGIGVLHRCYNTKVKFLGELLKNSTSVLSQSFNQEYEATFQEKSISHISTNQPYIFIHMAKQLVLPVAITLNRINSSTFDSFKGSATLECANAHAGGENGIDKTNHPVEITSAAIEVILALQWSLV